MGALIEEHLPGVPTTLSHQLVPIAREYRARQATIDASLKPLMQALRRRAGPARGGMRGGSAGLDLDQGCNQIEDVIARPIQLAKSGPSMAPVAAQTLRGSRRRAAI